MDSPFYPACAIFGPLLLAIFLLVLMGKRRKEVPRAQIVAAFSICLGIALAGVAASFLLWYRR